MPPWREVSIWLRGRTETEGRQKKKTDEKKIHPTMRSQRLLLA